MYRARGLGHWLLMACTFSVMLSAVMSFMVDVFDHSASCERGCQNGICESVFYSDQMNWSDNREVDGKDSEID